MSAAGGLASRWKSEALSVIYSKDSTCMYQMQSQSRDRLSALQSLRRGRTCLCEAQHAPALPEPKASYL
eukprot:4875510-Pleurochrysis_carterae.AAC.7